EINHITGTFTVKTVLGGSVVDWSGNATYDRITPGLGGAVGVYTLASGSVTGVFSGTSGSGAGCQWTGTQTFPLVANDAVTVLSQSPLGFEPPFNYNIEAHLPGADLEGITLTNCTDPNDNGKEYEGSENMSFYTETHVSDDGLKYQGSSFEEPGSGYTV